MNGSLTSSRAGLAFICVTMTACAASDVRQKAEAPDFVIQHTLSALTSEQSFTWQDTSGRSLVIRPLGTFQSGEVYCRDYEVRIEGLGGRPARRTACRSDDRWIHVDPSEL